jgi:hypothetical protein
MICCTAVHIKLDIHLVLAWICSTLIINQFIQRARIVPQSKTIYSEHMVAHHPSILLPRIFPGRSRTNPGKVQLIAKFLGSYLILLSVPFF